MSHTLDKCQITEKDGLQCTDVPWISPDDWRKGFMVEREEQSSLTIL